MGAPDCAGYGRRVPIARANKKTKSDVETAGSSQRRSAPSGIVRSMSVKMAKTIVAETTTRTSAALENAGGALGPTARGAVTMAARMPAAATAFTSDAVLTAES
jgi:hypothetical protein